MSDPHANQPFPAHVLYAAGALVVASLVLALIGRVTGFGTTKMPDTEPVQTVEVRFEDRAQEGLAVFDASTGHELLTFDAGTDGFVRGVVRSFTRERKLESIGREPNFVLSRWDNGRMAIEDPAINRVVELNGFGRDNAAIFARVLAAANGVGN